GFQEMLAGWLGVDVGKYVHVVGSAHIYVSDLPKVKRILSLSGSSDKPDTLYAACRPLDARLSKRDFEAELRKLLAVEEAARGAHLLEEGDLAKISGTFG